MPADDTFFIYRSPPKTEQDDRHRASSGSTIAKVTVVDCGAWATGHCSAGARYWLTGPKAGSHDIFVDNLPSFPDNLTAADDGTFWVALYQPRRPMLDWLQNRPFIKAQLARLPSSLLTGSSTRASTALQIDASSKPLRAPTDTTGHIFGLTTAVPHDGYLYLGTDHSGSNDVMRYPLK